MGVVECCIMPSTLREMRQEQRPEEEEETLLSDHTIPQPRSRRWWPSLLALSGLPLILLLFLPLSALLHPIASSLYSSPKATSSSKQFDWSPGQDPYLEAHPSALRAAQAAELGPWASQDTSQKHSAAEYAPVGKTRSNGTHIFEKTAIIVSLDGVRCVALEHRLFATLTQTGYRADYLTRNMTPHLLSLSHKGLRAEYMEGCPLPIPQQFQALTQLYTAVLPQLNISQPLVTIRLQSTSTAAHWSPTGLS